MNHDRIVVYRSSKNVKQYICNKQQYLEIVHYAFYNFVNYVVHSIFSDTLCAFYLYYLPEDEENCFLHDVLSETLKNNTCKQYKMYKIYNKNRIEWVHFFSKLTFNSLTDNVLITLTSSQYCILLISEDNNTLINTIENLI